MRTLDVARLITEDLGCLCAIEQLNRGVLNESVVQLLFALRKEVEQQRKETLREQSEKAGLKAEIEGLKDVKKKSEDELKRSAEVNEAQGRELGQLKGENKAKEDRLVEETGKLKEEIR
jgi:septal ring factor EnvC (AmiA/AmiB activator)